MRQAKLRRGRAAVKILAYRILLYCNTVLEPEVIYASVTKTHETFSIQRVTVCSQRH